MLRIRLFCLTVVCRYHDVMARITGNTLHGCTCDERDDDGAYVGWQYCPHVQVVELQHELERRRLPETPYSRIMTRRERLFYPVVYRLEDYADRVCDREYEKAGQPFVRSLTFRERIACYLANAIENRLSAISVREWNRVASLPMSEDDSIEQTRIALQRKRLL